ncbi:MAG: type II toxin-antitoxin system RelE/ParE family toxin, partial [Emcibacteraceae bacterium]|nr:type II toxin-antitoxin system RelE/ParE family toxin [Emcibacteraceae bacterium]
MGKIGEYRVTKEANADIRKVGEYTEKSWGKAQRRLYLTDMHEKFIQIANNPQMALLNKTFKPP